MGPFLRLVDRRRQLSRSQYRLCWNIDISIKGIAINHQWSRHEPEMELLLSSAKGTFDGAFAESAEDSGAAEVFVPSALCSIMEG